MGGTTSMLYSGAVEATAGAVLGGVVCSITNRYEMQKTLDVTLYSLQQEVMKIHCAVNAARTRHITDRQLLMWLASLIDAVYLGNYYHRTFKNRMSCPPMIESDVRGSSHIQTYGANKRRRTIKYLLFGDDELEKLHDVVKMLRSIHVREFLHMVNVHPERPVKIYLYMNQNKLLNRDMEKEQVMNFLFEPSIACANNVDILPIIGPSGIGKTTLALHCFYDPKVQNHFSMKIYITKSNIGHPGPHDFQCPTIYENILKRCNSININHFDENTLIVMLKQNLSSERFLLLMDSVLCTDSMVWNSLYDCLKCGKQGSKVLCVSDLTTYHNSNKGIINSGKVEPIQLDAFSEDEYTSFFNEHAFGSADAEDYPELAVIGREIEKKMNRSIWGAKILGELLRDNLNASFWTKFLQDGVLSSDFQWHQGLFSVSKTLSQLLPKRPKVENVITSWGQSVQLLSRGLKSFRELMVLDPSYCTPVINEGKDYGVQFLVTKHFTLYEYIVVTAICKSTLNERKFLLGNAYWVHFTDK